MTGCAAAGRKLASGAAGDRRPRCLERAVGAPACALAWPAVRRRNPGAHLAVINLGLKTIPVGRRRHRDRETRLLAIAHGLLAAAEIGLKEHDRLVLARTLFERKLEGRRASSKLPELVELVMA